MASEPRKIVRASIDAAQQVLAIADDGTLWLWRNNSQWFTFPPLPPREVPNGE